MLNTLENFQILLKYSFKNEYFLKQCFTHPSYASEKKLPYNNQRLEFLGDSVIQIIVSDYLFKKFPDKPEGELTILRSGIVQKTALAQLARNIGISNFLLLGKGEKEQGGLNKDSNLCDAFEALIGAIYLDSDITTATNIFLSIAEESLSKLELSTEEKNPKGALQELLQKSGISKPEYRINSIEGKEHSPLFTVEVVIDGKIISSGKGSNLKNAEKNAALSALKIIKKEEIKNEN